METQALARLSHTEPMISAMEREPGSTCPKARSPKNDERPRVASMWAVAAALSKAH